MVRNVIERIEFQFTPAQSRRRVSLIICESKAISIHSGTKPETAGLARKAWEFYISIHSGTKPETY